MSPSAWKVFWDESGLAVFLWQMNRPLYPRHRHGCMRMDYNFHLSPEDKGHRMLNAIELGTDIPIHRHPTKDESFVVLSGRVRSTTYNDDGSVNNSVVLSQADGLYGVDIPKGVWHKLESRESGGVVFECKAGPFVTHEVEGILEVQR